MQKGMRFSYKQVSFHWGFFNKEVTTQVLNTDLVAQ